MKAGNTWKCNCEKGVCLCTMKDLENFVIKSSKKVVVLQLALQISLRMRASARHVGGVFYPTPLIIPVREWTLNLLGLLHVTMASLVIYLMNVCNWKNNAIIPNIQAHFPEGDTVSGLGVS